MPKTKISEFSATPGNNTDIDGINISEGCAPSGINDAIRELMAQLKDFQAGTAGDSFNGPVGTTTPAAGAFTNLSASGTFALTGDQVQISEGGTGQTTANAAFNALAPSQATHAGKYLKTDGANTSWDALDISTADITGTLPVANGGTGVTSSTGTGSVVLSASPTFTGTVNGAALTLSSNFTLSGGTANGVAYLNGSKVLTTGSALTFDGTNFTYQSAISLINNDGSGNKALVTPFAYGGSGATGTLVLSSTYGNANQQRIRVGVGGAAAISFDIDSAEGARLTSTGLGIGTSSPAVKLDVSGADGVRSRVIATSGGTSGLILSSAGNTAYTIKAGNADNSLRIDQDGTDRLTLASGGNLGLGVTPSAWSLANGAAIDIGTVGTIVSQQSGSTVTTEFGRNFYYNGTNFIYKVSGGVARYSFGSSAHNWFIAPSGTAGNAISFTQAMTLTSGGNLLVGTTNDIGYKVSTLVSSSATPQLAFAATNTNQSFTVKVSTDGAHIGSGGGNTIFDANGSERARITSGGLFCINIAGDTYSSDASLIVNGTGRTRSIYSNINGTASSTHISFANGNGVVGSITTSGSATAYNTTSDYRLKTFIAKVTNAGSRLDALNPVEYEWKADGKRTRGFFAHEFQAVYADSVTGQKDAVDEEGKPVYQSMQASSSEVIADLVAEIQSLRARVAALETK